jgi:hypothetical protein
MLEMDTITEKRQKQKKAEKRIEKGDKNVQILKLGIYL